MGRTRPGPFPNKGPLSLQDHGNPTRFRNVWYRELPPRAAEGGTDGWLATEAAMAKRHEIARSIRQDAETLSDPKNPVPQMLRLFESLVYEQEPAARQKAEAMAGQYVASLKTLSPDQLNAKKRRGQAPQRRLQVPHPVQHPLRTVRTQDRRRGSHQGAGLGQETVETAAQRPVPARLRTSGPAYSSTTMKTTAKINVAVVGLGFGAEFIPIWQKHPHTRCVAVCQRNPEKLNAVGDYFGVDKRYTDFQALLRDPEVQAVHINTPIPDHASMSIAALKAASTSPAPCRWPPALRTVGRSWT